MIFALSTVICWAHYGTTCLTYFTPSKKAGRIYLLGYCASVIVGSLISESAAWELSDVCVAAMTLINISAVMLLRKKVKEETEITFGGK